MENGLLTENAQEFSGYMEGGGWAAETLGARSHTADRLRPHQSPSLEHEDGPQLVIGRECGWLRHLPSVTQEPLSGEELDKGEASVAYGGNIPSLSSLFADAFPDDDRHQGWLPESTRESSRGGGGGGTRSTCSSIVGTDRSSPHSQSALPPLMPGDGADATMNEKNPLVGITVRRPPSPRFSFMAKDSSPDASASPATYPKHWTQGDTQQRDVQGTSCVDGIDAWMSGASQHGDDSAQSSRSSGIPFEDGAELRFPSAPIMNEAGARSADEGRMTGEDVRIPALSRKRRHPAAREAIAPKESHRSPSADFDGASSTSEDDACFGGQRRNGWWGTKLSYMSLRDQTAVGASRLQVDDLSCGQMGHLMKKHGEASRATSAGCEPATAEDSARCERRDTAGNETPAAFAGDGEMPHVEGDGRRGGGDSRVALAYDQDVLGGEGAAEADVGDFEPQTVAGVLGKLRCDKIRSYS